MNEMHIDALKYVGGKSEQTFTVLPLEIDDPERQVTFTKEQIMISGVDITEKALYYLVRDYPRSFEHIHKEIAADKLFKMFLSKLIVEHNLNEQTVRMVVDQIYKKDRLSRKSKVTDGGNVQEVGGGINAR
jgi:hypothetical protein